MKEKRCCKICKTKIQGRKDKMYCSTKCKSEYNHRLQAATKIVTGDIDAILHRNRSCLLEIMGKNNVKMKIDRSELDKKNFKYSYITHYHINKFGKMVHYVYDFSWIIFSDQEILINRIRRK